MRSLGLIGLAFLIASCSQNELSDPMLARVNEARAQGATCGDTRYPPTEPLSLDPVLERAAQVHAQDMAQKEFLSHTGSDGSRVGDRATDQGYVWRRIGENIASGQKSIQQVVEDWLESPGHCANLMNSQFQDAGFARVGNYWVQVFARK